ncbi:MULTISPECIES: biliverdin-producing heme oxygenase [unclassified Pseudoalteromonas]|uniref:biliverdin-producing heme oxygenase n=1 Tax=unclassified Pseudoalteromonas TaxID=194690 RepID=UPI00209745AC|nr:biliverdin-producing heme oxygenase [Pseudoalteromonas sp. XMcav2-N]MCO7188092.1 biliverdin-producing heme oxygenase [Pseudoalteromonas sp. XMcav2-N]
MSNLRAEHYPRMSKLRTSTSAVHDQLDKKIMDQSPFASKEHYGLFLRYQYHLMNYVASLYQGDQLALMINNLKSRDRTEQLLADFQDLDMAQPTQIINNAQFNASLHESLGWLYVVEGSKLGAAVLAKEAKKLGLDSAFGARFLSGSGAGRGSHWRQFMQDIESLTLSEQQEQEMLSGAQAAFKFANQLVELSYNQTPNLTTDVA